MPAAMVINNAMNYSELRKIAANPGEIQRIEKRTSFLTGHQIPLRQRIWHMERGIFVPVLCQCGTPVKWNTKDKAYRRFCSSKCANNDSAVITKREETCLSRFGTKTNLAAESNKEKQRKTLVTRYGVDNFAKTKAFAEKYKKTCMDQYGVTNTSKLPAVKKKIGDTHMQKYGRSRYSQVHISEFVIALKDDADTMRYWFNELKMPVSEIADLLGVNHSQLCIHFKNNLGIDITRHSVSSVERQIADYIRSLGVSIEQSNRQIIKPKELDIVIPSKNLAIEVHGLAWHCELRGKGKDYHIGKLQGCNSQGIDLVQVLDYEWMHKQDIVKSRLASMVGKNNTIYARKCRIVTPKPDEVHKFFCQNHIQGMSVSKVAYGLEYNSRLVAVMSFGKSRFNKNYQWELIRFSNELYTTVVGGASRLFKHFLAEQNPKSVISYCDLRWNTGKLYSTLGFQKIRESGPNFWYTHGYRTFESRMRYQKYKLPGLLENFAPEKTAWENMVSHGYDRFWDCGNAVYTYVST